MELVRFFAGDIELAVAARGTKRVGDDDGSVIHVCDLLGVSRSGRSSRVLDVEHAGRRVALRVDEPIRFAALDAGGALAASGKDLLPAHVIGFADLGGEVVTLVRIAVLAQLALEHADSTEGTRES